MESSVVTHLFKNTKTFNVNMYTMSLLLMTAHMRRIYTPLPMVEQSLFTVDTVCGAPKRRFRTYQPAVSKNANATDARKARKEQLKKDEAIG